MYLTKHVSMSYIKSYTKQLTKTNYHMEMNSTSMLSQVEAGILGKLSDKEAELSELFGSVNQKLTEMIQKVDELKIGQVRSIANNYGKVVCESMLELLEAKTIFESDAERNAWGAKVKENCEQWSLHVSCLPKEDDARESILLMSEFAQSLCLTGTIMCLGSGSESIYRSIDLSIYNI